MNDLTRGLSSIATGSPLPEPRGRDTQTCEECGGEGTILVPARTVHDRLFPGWSRLCPAHREPCMACEGVGVRELCSVCTGFTDGGPGSPCGCD